MVDELFSCLDESTLMELWPCFREDFQKIEKYTTTNIKAANIALNSILDDREKIQLEKLFFADDGWYKSINNCGMTQLKFAAMSLGLTNKILTYDQKQEEDMLAIASELSEDEQLLNARCYLKQKAVTYSTMKKYLVNVKKKKDMTIELYRGVRIEGEVYEYSHSGLECWTTSPYIAEKFARQGGYVIKKEYPISSIFAGNRSTFKNRSNNLYRHNGFYVRREHEIIVENIDTQYILKNNFYRPIDVDFY